MKFTYNEVFAQLLTAYDLPDDLSFSVDLPMVVKKILDDQIVVTDLGITLNSFGRLYKAMGNGENQSVVEDNENHFHVDSYAKPFGNKTAFMLGVKTLTLLAGKFKEEKMEGIRFYYSFSTPKMGWLWAKENNLHTKGDMYCISDRLSFYKLREGEEIISKKLFEDPFYAMLTIDI